LSSSDELEDVMLRIRSQYEEVTEVMETKEAREATDPDESEEEDDDDDEEDEEEDKEEAEEELEDVEGLLFARFLGRLAGGLAARTSSTPAAVNRNSLPSRSS
jgi:hypothetical protein